MTATKTNERPGTRAMHRYCGLSASKARQVLDLIRGEDVQRAAEILTGTDREAAEIIGKVLTSAVSIGPGQDLGRALDVLASDEVEDLARLGGRQAAVAVHCTRPGALVGLGGGHRRAPRSWPAW